MILRIYKYLYKKEVFSLFYYLLLSEERFKYSIYIIIYGAYKMSRLYFSTLGSSLGDTYQQPDPEGGRTQIPLHIPARNPLHDDWSETPQSEKGPGHGTSEHGYQKIDEDNDPTRVNTTIDDVVVPYTTI